ncbi:MAG: BF3164 family lipoprotein [Cyclobacteriaceae bacterium]
MNRFRNRYLMLLYVKMIFIIFSCKYSDTKVITIDEFPNNIEIHTTELDEIFLDCPERFNLVNGLLVTTTNCNENLLKIIDPEKGYFERFIAKGSGPGEFLQLYFSGHRQGDSLYFRNLSGEGAWLHPVKIKENPNYEFTRINEPDFLANAENVFHFETSWAYTDLNGESFMIIKDKHGVELQRVEHFPPVSYPVEGATKGYLYYSNTTYNDHHRKFVSGLRYFPYLIITNHDGAVVRIIKTGKEYAEPVIRQGELTPQSDTEYFYDQVVTTDEYIYALRMNTTLEVLSSLQFNPVLEVFDWSGNAMYELQFDRLVGGITIDNENGFMYGGSICYERYVPVLVRATIDANFSDK